MKITSLVNIVLSLTLSIGVYAGNTKSLNPFHDPDSSSFGSAGFSSGPDGWYDISTDSYPIATPFSRDRNVGISNGSVYLSPTGLTLGEGGNYEVHIAAVLQNPESSDLIVPVFLAVEKPGDPITSEIDPENPNPIGGVGIVSDDTFLTNIQGFGFLTNVEPGTRLSLIATNGGYPEPQPVTVVSWFISAKKID